MTLVRYFGWMDLQDYPGTVTKTAYPFGLFRRLGYIDNRDLPELLKTIEDGQKVFECQDK